MARADVSATASDVWRRATDASVTRDSPADLKALREDVARARRDHRPDLEGDRAVTAQWKGARVAPPAVRTDERRDVAREPRQLGARERLPPDPEEPADGDRAGRPPPDHAGRAGPRARGPPPAPPHA